MSAPCRGCTGTVRLKPGEIERMVADYLHRHPDHVRTDEKTVAARMDTCAVCHDLLYGSTCRHCGCLVAVRARLAGAVCPHPGGRRW